MKLLVSGGMGFIGSHFIRYVLREHIDWEVVNLDKLTYAGNLENLKDVQGNHRYRFVRGDIVDRDLVNNLLSEGFDVSINFAAESHVDKSIRDSLPFIETNIKGTQVLLEGARQYNVKKFIQISTDEVYGSLGSEGEFSEESPLLPNSPYAASKAAADLLCRAYYQTYSLPVIIVRSSNNFGPYQYPEKLIPVLTISALQDKPLPIYGQGENIRDWIYVLDNCAAIDCVLQQGQVGEIYNIGAGNERENLEIANLIVERLSKPKNLIKFVEDRLGHDFRYSLDITKITKLGWKPKYGFEDALNETIRWYRVNEWWWKPLLP